MTLQQLIEKANSHFGIDVTMPTNFSGDGFEPRCLTTYYAITNMKAPYNKLADVMKSDRNELRLMWLYAEGNLGVVNKRRAYKAFTNTL
jgi:hypothetical protein